MTSILENRSQATMRHLDVARPFHYAAGQNYRGKIKKQS